MHSHDTSAFYLGSPIVVIIIYYGSNSGGFTGNARLSGSGDAYKYNLYRYAYCHCGFVQECQRLMCSKNSEVDVKNKIPKLIKNEKSQKWGSAESSEPQGSLSLCS